MTILVTGGAGYIGSVTVERLRAKGEHVVVLDDLFRGPPRARWIRMCRFIRAAWATVRSSRASSRNTRLKRASISRRSRTWANRSPSRRSISRTTSSRASRFLSTLMRRGRRRSRLFIHVRHVWRAEEIPDSRDRTPQWPVNPYGWSKLLMERMLASATIAPTASSLSRCAISTRRAPPKRCGEDHEPESHLVPNVLAAALGEEAEVLRFWQRTIRRPMEPRSAITST